MIRGSRKIIASVVVVSIAMFFNVMACSQGSMDVVQDSKQYNQAMDGLVGIWCSKVVENCEGVSSEPAREGGDCLTNAAYWGTVLKINKDENSKLVGNYLLPTEETGVFTGELDNNVVVLESSEIKYGEASSLKFNFTLNADILTGRIESDAQASPLCYFSVV